MKFEKSEEEKSIESTIEEIKKSEAEKEVENAVEEFEVEAISEAIKDEMPVNKSKDKPGVMAETEKLIEEMELNPEARERRKARERLIEYSKEVYEIGKNYEMIYSHFDPMKGDSGRSYNQEMDLFLEKRKENADYKPVFTYPGVDKLNIEDLKREISNLENIEEKAEVEENKNVKIIVLEMIFVVKSKINILIELKKGNLEKAFENAKSAYGDIDDGLCKNAEEWHKKKMEFLKEKKEKGIVKSEIEKILEENEFDAEDIKKYFDLALDKGNLRYKNIEVIIDTNDEGVESIDVRPSDQNYDHPVILIPANRKVKGMKLMQLIAHEIGCHVTQNKYNYKLGLEGVSYGRDWETVQEGFAMRNEAKTKQRILGDLYSDFEIQSGSYYILAMNKIKQGANIGEVYDYIFDLKKEEFLAEGDNKDKAKEKADKGAKTVLRRVSRGVYPYYFPKDIAYLKGELMAREIEKEGVDKYILQSRIDPVLVPDMIKAGIYPRFYAYEKGLELATKVAEQIWEDKGWPVEYLKDKNKHRSQLRDDK